MSGDTFFLATSYVPVMMAIKITESGTVFEVNSSGKHYLKGRIIQSGLSGDWHFYANVTKIKTGLFRSTTCVEPIGAEIISEIDKWIKKRKM